MATAELTSLKNKRRTIKGRLTKAEKYFLELVVDAADLMTCQVKKKRFDEIKDDFYDIQDKIVEISDETQNDAETEETCDVDDRAEVVDLIFEKVLKKFNISSFAAEIPNTNGAEKKPMQVKLPEVKLPQFSGQFDDYLDFKRDFNSLVGNDVSPELKLIYLRSCLTGDAKKLEGKEETFDSLWETITNTYENKRYLLNKHIESIMNEKPMARGSSSDLKSIINNAKKCVRAFNNLDMEPNPLTEAFLIHIVNEKLDFNIRNDFDLTLKRNELPTWKEFVDFLEKRSNCLESIEASKKKNIPKKDETVAGKKTKVFANMESKNPEKKENQRNPNNDKNKILKCYLCSGNHYLNVCKCFLDLSLNEKWDKVANMGLCEKSLAKGHKLDACPRFSCTECSGPHHNLLHGKKPANNDKNNDDKKFNGTLQMPLKSKQIVLGTALIFVHDKYGNKHTCRCLLDSGAMSNFITESLAQRLGLKRDKIRFEVVTLNENQINVKHSLSAKIESRNSNFSRSVDFLVVPQIAGLLPIKSFEMQGWKLDGGVTFADEGFNKPSRIDLLIGMEVYHEIFRTGSKIVIGEGKPVLEESELGYVVSGTVGDTPHGSGFSGLNYVGFSVSNEELHQELKKLWELEDVSSKKVLSIEEREVQKHFESTHYRYDDGRYGVYLPFKSDIQNLGSSKEQALKRYLNLEKKLNQHPALKEEYQKFIHEYSKLNHMELYADDVADVPAEGHYFLPHHAVLKPSSSTTKLRVVFDGSALTKNGLSLNSVTKTGPVVQSDYLNTLVRFRFIKFAFSCDAVKMYRQVRVHSSQRRYQCILCSLASLV